MVNDLHRFLKAQHGVFQTAIDELESGLKRSHWIWFIFPQLHGLGHSENSKKYGIHDLREAKAYLDHPILGSRLVQATRAILDSKVHPREVLGEIDYQKFISCMTLFMLAAADHSIFASVLQDLSTIDMTTKQMLGVNNDGL